MKRCPNCGSDASEGQYDGGEAMDYGAHGLMACGVCGYCGRVDEAGSAGDEHGPPIIGAPAAVLREWERHEREGVHVRMIVDGEVGSCWCIRIHAEGEAKDVRLSTARE